jgi:4-amino-4-deoxy-L-arabinose transferase-like glycosyltransferase
MKIKLIYPVFVLSGIFHFLAAISTRTFVFDECYYIPAARDILSGAVSNLEHPPLAKFIMAGSIATFGDNWFAWRLPIIVFALVATFLTYKIGCRFLSEKQATFAAALLSASVIFFVVGSVAMLDMPMIAFCLAGLYLVLKEKYVFAGVMFGLGFLSKEIALLMFGVAVVYLFVKKVPYRRIFPFLVVFTVVCFMGMWAYEIAYQPVVGHTLITNPFQQASIWITYQFNLNGIRNPNATMFYPPIGWVTPFGTNALHPQAWHWEIFGSRMMIQWLSQPNPMVEYFMFPLLAALPFLWKRNEGDKLKLIWLWLTALYLPWLLVGLFVRTESNFYIVYSSPMLALGATYLLTQIKKSIVRQVVGATLLIVAFAFFLYWFPIVVFR